MKKLTVLILLNCLFLQPLFFNDGYAFEKLKTEIIIKNLEIPWEIRFLPDKSMLITERFGYLTLFKNGFLERIKVDNVSAIGEGGLLGLAIHPDYLKNHWIYLYRTTEIDGKHFNQVIRFIFENNKLIQDKIIVNHIPANRIHNGGRIAFGPDGYLYITTGDSDVEELAQDKNSLAGKILRVDENGKIPTSNPFGSEVYSYGHRNPQGLAWDKEGRLWATEHGPIGHDKLNLIEAGKNYGWPIIPAGVVKAGYIAPVLQSGEDTWAPAGLAYWEVKKEGFLFFGGLRGTALYRVIFKPTVKLEENFKEQFGRIRAVTVGPDNALYISTSNLDGRALTKKSIDDLIIKISVESRS